MAGRYPLQALRRVLHKRVEDRKSDVGSALGRARESRRHAERARAAEARARAEARAMLSQERTRLEQAGARVADLASADRYRLWAEQQGAALGAERHAADQTLAQRLAQVEQARHALADANARAEALERHHGRFVAEEERQAELERDEAGLEIWMNQRRGNR